MAKTVLLLDDPQGSLGDLTDALEKAGYPCTSIVGGDAASEFDIVEPQLVFLSMQDSDAAGICDEIRNKPTGAIVPIIFIGTGAEEISTPAEALARGGDFYYQHPLSFDTVLDKVKTYVGAGDLENVPGGRGDAAGNGELDGDDDELTADMTVITSAPFADDLDLIDATLPAEEPEPEAREVDAEDDLAAVPAPDLRAPKASKRSPSRDAKDYWEEISTSEEFVGEDGWEEAGADEPTLATSKAPELPDFDWRKPKEADDSELADASDELLGKIRDEEGEIEVAAAARGAGASPVKAVLESEDTVAEPRPDGRARQAKKEKRLRADEEARQEAEEKARLEVEREARQKAEEKARLEAEREARQKAEEKARLEAEREARQKAEEKARLEAEREAREKAEEKARLEAEREARQKAEEKARLEAEREAREKATQQRLRAEEAVQREAELRRQIEEEYRAKAEEKRRKAVEAKRKAEEEARREAAEAERKAEEEARRRENEETARVEAALEARLRAEEEERVRIEQEAKREARRRVEEEERLQAEREERRRVAEEERAAAEKKPPETEEDIRQRIEAEIRAKLEAEARAGTGEEAEASPEDQDGVEYEEVEEEVEDDEGDEPDEEEEREQKGEQERQRAEEEARLRAEEEARLRAEEEARQRAEEEARLRAEEEARLRAEEETRLRAEEDARLRVEQEARSRAQEKPPLTAALHGAAPAEEEIRRRIEADVRREMGLESLSEPAPAPVLPPVVPEHPAAPQRLLAEPKLLRPHGLLPPSKPEGALTIMHDIAVILHDYWRQQTTGRLSLLETRSGRQKAVFFERGRPVAAYSSQQTDRIEEYLYLRGFITRAQYHEVRSKKIDSPRRIGAFLVDEGFLKPHELFDAVRGHLEECLFGLFSWENGSFTYQPEVVTEEERVALERDPPALLLEGIRRKQLLERLVARVGAASSLLASKPGIAESVDLDGLGLSADERQVVRLLDGTHSIEDLVFSTNLEAQQVYAVLAALLAVGYAEVTVVGIEGVDARGTSPVDAIDSARIRERLQAVRELDYFQILGIPRTATPYETDRAYERMVKDFTANRFSEQIQRNFHEDLLEIKAVIEDARLVLRDELLRDAYARNLPL